MPICVEKIRDMHTLLKYVKMQNMWQSHICIKLICLDRAALRVAANTHSCEPNQQNYKP